MAPGYAYKKLSVDQLVDLRSAVADEALAAVRARDQAEALRLARLAGELDARLQRRSASDTPDRLAERRQRIAAEKAPTMNGPGGHGSRGGSRP